MYLDQAEVLHATELRAEAVLRKTMREIAAGDLISSGSTLVLAGSADERRHFASLVPFRPDHGATAIFTDFVVGRLPIAMLTIVDPQGNREALARMLARLYRLTAAETALALCLRNGMSMRDYATTRNLSIHTVRNQLRAVLDKTGTHRQGELIALINSLI